MELKNFTINGKFSEAPSKTIRHSPHFELLIELGDDATGKFIVDEDGIKWLKENNFT